MFGFCTLYAASCLLQNPVLSAARHVTVTSSGDCSGAVYVGTRVRPALPDEHTWAMGADIKPQICRFSMTRRLVRGTSSHGALDIARGLRLSA